MSAAQEPLSPLAGHLANLLEATVRAGRDGRVTIVGAQGVHLIDCRELVLNGAFRGAAAEQLLADTVCLFALRVKGIGEKVCKRT